VVANLVIPALGRQRQENREFKASMDYTASSRQAGLDPISKKKKKKNSKKFSQMILNKIY
jgi:hypothetical protein